MRGAYRLSFAVEICRSPGLYGTLATTNNPGNYISSLAYLLAGCVILGFGVYTEVLANVAMIPGESFVRAVSSTWKTEFGSTKVAFDVSLTVIAGVLSFLFAHRLDGVREGTIIAALLVGFIARLFGRRLSFLEPLLFSKKQQAAGENAGETAVEESAAAKRPVIVIGRQYGSGGHSGNYDLTIDTEMGAETVQEIICRTLELRQKQQ